MMQACWKPQPCSPFRFPTTAGGGGGGKEGRRQLCFFWNGNQKHQDQKSFHSKRVELWFPPCQALWNLNLNWRFLPLNPRYFTVLPGSSVPCLAFSHCALLSEKALPYPCLWPLKSELSLRTNSKCQCIPCPPLHYIHPSLLSDLCSC